jgi:hypothetical protein
MLECNPETLHLIVDGLTQKIGYDIRAGKKPFLLYSIPLLPAMSMTQSPTFYSIKIIIFHLMWYLGSNFYVNGINPFSLHAFQILQNLYFERE